MFLVYTIETVKSTNHNIYLYYQTYPGRCNTTEASTMNMHMEVNSCLTCVNATHYKCRPSINAYALLAESDQTCIHVNLHVHIKTVHAMELTVLIPSKISCCHQNLSTPFTLNIWPLISMQRCSTTPHIAGCVINCVQEIRKSAT